MSSFRGNRGGRGGFTPTATANAPRQPRPGFQVRARNQLNGARGRGNSQSIPRGRQPQATTPQGPRSKTPQPLTSSGDPQQRFQQLKERRDNERKDAIRNGFLADPDKPRTLAEAITPVGTCPDMCAEFERIERIVQKDVWSQETREDGSPDEARMVKKFRRAAAGIDEQLPSDLRPPATLKKTCDYLFDHLIESADSLATVHHFVWDRTRAIRNDFSIQQITNADDVQIAVECYERIARFHILSLHQFAVPEKPYDKYAWFQEREQLDRTLLSLVQYYDDNRHRIQFKNEAEFRAYCIIFQIQDPIPDLEDRVGCWSPEIRQHSRVRIALELYAAACNTSDPQGPLKPRAPSLVAREDWNGFFTKVESVQVSYLMACVSEIYFNMVRRQILSAVWKGSRKSASGNQTEFTIDALTDLLRFDDPEQSRNFCEHYGFGFKELPDGTDEVLDLRSVQTKDFPEATQGLSEQLFSQSVVENKRVGRTFSAVIRGYTLNVARSEGLVNEEEGHGGDEDMVMDGNDDDNSLFIPQDPQPALAVEPAKPSNSLAGVKASNGKPQPNGTNPFAAQSASSNTFATPSIASNPFAAPPGSSNAFAAQTSTSNPFAAKSTVNTGTALVSTTPTGSPFAAKGGLQDSKFAPNSQKATSPFSTFGKPSTGAWDAPATTSNTKPGSAFSLGSSILGQSTSQSSISQNGDVKPASTLASIHAPSSFNFGLKPSAASQSPWAKPPSSTPSVAASPFGGALSPEGKNPAANASDTVVTKPSSQQSLPSFTNPSDIKQPFGSTKSDGTASATPSVNQQAQDLSTQTSKQTGDSIFNNPITQYAPSKASDASDDKTKKSLFSFPTSQASSAQTFENTPKSIFNFSTPSQPSTSEKSSEADKQSVFTIGKGGTTQGDSKPFFSFATPTAPPSTSTTSEASKPFTFPASQSSFTPQSPATTTLASPQPPATSSANVKSTTIQVPPSSSKVSPGPKSPTSTFSHPNQPKKRSPLSQSYTADDERTAASISTSTINFDSTPKSSTEARGSGSQAPFKPPPQPTVVAPTSRKASANDVLQRLATEMVLHQAKGLLRQFVEYQAKAIIMNVYEEQYIHEMNEAADKFRREKIAKRYGRKWRENSWRLRLARQGKEKREKRRTARRDRTHIHTKSLQQADTDAVDDFLKSRTEHGHQQSSLSSSFLSSVSTTSQPFKKPLLPYSSTEKDLDQIAGSTTETPKRAIKSNRVDPHGKIIKPSTPNSAADNGMRRSHFLGYSLPKQRSIMGDATPRQSSRSAYFRMKALGLNPGASSVGNTMGPPPLNLKKRSRDDQEADTADPSPPHKKPRTPPQSSFTDSTRMRSASNASRSSSLDLSGSPGTSVGASRALSRLELADQDLLARARAARQALRTSPRSQVGHRDDDDAMSITPQSDAPSLQRARVQARLRAVERAESHLAQSLTQRPDVPAYRLRESRFVPREHYGRAVERAQENIARKSISSGRIASEERSLEHDARDSGDPDPDIAATASIEAKAEEPVYPQEHVEHSMPPEHVPPSPEESNDTAMAIRTEEEDHLPLQADEEAAAIEKPLSGPVEQSALPEDADMETNEAPYFSQSISNESADSHAAMPLVGEASTIPSFPLYEPPDRSTTVFGNPVPQSVDTAALAASAYLNFGQDDEDTAAAPASLYPELHVPSMDQHMDEGFSGDVLPMPPHDLPNDMLHAAEQAFGLDSSMQDDEPDSTPDLPGINAAAAGGYTQLSETVNGYRAPSQIDPSLLEDAQLSTEETEGVLPDAESLEKVVVEENITKGNPFAALADIPSDDDDASDVESASAPEEQAEEVKTPDEHEEGDVSFKQTDDDHFVTNGIIQDEIQDAQQPDLTVDTSFSSMPAPVEERTQSAEPPPTPRYHTRSRSRELSAQPSRNGFMSPTPGDRALSTTPAPASQLSESQRLETVQEDVEEVMEEPSEAAEGDADLPATTKDVQREQKEDVDEDDDDEEEEEEEEEEEGSEDELPANGRPATDAEEDASLDDSAGGEEGESSIVESDEEEASIARRQASPKNAASAVNGDEEEYTGDEGEGEEDGIDYSQEYDEEEEEEYDEDEDEDEEDDPYASGAYSRGRTPGELQESGLIKGGTGQTAEDAFELSD